MLSPAEKRRVKCEDIHNVSPFKEVNVKEDSQDSPRAKKPRQHFNASIGNNVDIILLSTS